MNDNNPLLDVKFWFAAFPERIDKAISDGADINGQTEEGFTPLMLSALACSETDAIRHLVSVGADIDKQMTDGSTALSCAAQGSYDPRIIDLLIELGADVNHTIQKGWTPL